MHSFFLSEKQPFILQAKSVKHCITNNLTTMMIVLVFETFLLFFCVFSPLVIFRSFSNPLHLLSADVHVRELRVSDRKFFYSANRLLSEVVTNTNLDYCYAILHIFDHFLLEFVDTDLNQYDIWMWKLIRSLKWWFKMEWYDWSLMFKIEWYDVSLMFKMEWYNVSVITYLACVGFHQKIII